MLSGFNTYSAIFRTALAAVIGSCIGFGRGLHGRAAGGTQSHFSMCGSVVTVLCGLYAALSTHFLRFVQSSACDWIAVLRVTRGRHQFSSDLPSKWLEIVSFRFEAFA